MPVDQIAEMLEFYDARRRELVETAEALTGRPLTGFLGHFLMESAVAHWQMREWAGWILAEPCPPDDTPLQTQRVLWLTCLRLLRRQVACWSNHPDYDHRNWAPPTSNG